MEQFAIKAVIDQRDASSIGSLLSKFLAKKKNAIR